MAKKKKDSAADHLAGPDLSGLEEHPHTHSHTHTHAYHHSAEHRKRVSARLSRAIGHLESVKRMVEDDKDCNEILTQLSAVRAAVVNTGKLILSEHMLHCIVEAVEQGDNSAIEELNKTIKRFL